ncbi:MAG: hypothetical protein ACRBN8_40505 [Nannocystales bacterium]
MQDLKPIPLVLVVVIGCGPVVSADPSTEAGSTGSAGDTLISPTSGVYTAGSSTSGGPWEATTSVDTGLPSSGDDGLDDGGGFLGSTSGCGAGLEDGYLAHCGVGLECSTFEQNCPEGEACRPWANDGGEAWNARRCVPVFADPDAEQVGEVCSVEGSAVSGVDSCDVGLMCWGVDPDTLLGTCAQLCSGSADDPACADANETCMVANDDNVAVCLPWCDPLVPDCNEGFGCYPGSEQTFVCLREGAGVELGEVSHPQCAPGSFWASAEAVQGCVDDEPCCTSYCHVEDPEACGPDVECVPYFEPTMQIYNPLGYCSVAD